MSEPFRLGCCTVRTNRSNECGSHIGMLILQSPIMRRLMPTAKTTVLPADDSPTNRKDLFYARQLDDRRSSRSKPWLRTPRP